MLNELKRSHSEREKDLQGAFRSLAIQNGLNSDVLWLALHHNRSKELPYHGNTHSFNVAFDSYALGKAEGLDFSACKHLLVAGLFHDYNHSGGGLTDTENVENAVKGFMKYSTLLKHSLIDPEWVADLIRGTNTDSKEFAQTLEQGILRDADLLGWVYMPFEETASGLGEEFGIPVTKKSTHEFLKNSVFYTPTARKVLKASQWR